MRLDHRHHLAARRVLNIARGLEDGGYFDRMVAIIIDHAHAFCGSGGGEATFDPAKAQQALADIFDRHFKLPRHGYGGQSVQHIVAPRHGQLEIGQGLDLAPAELAHDVKARPVRAHGDARRPHLGLGIDAIGDQAAIIDARSQGLDLGMVKTDGGEAIEGDVFDKGGEGLLDRFEVAIVIQMFRIDIGDDGHGGLQLEEGTVAFIGLDHHPGALAHLGVGAIGVDDAAIDHGRIKPACIQKGRDHRGRGGLAVRAAHGDGKLKPHKLGQHFGAAHQRDASFARGGVFGIVRLDGGRIDHRRGAFDMGGVMADEDAGAKRGQAFGIGRGLGVGALHRIADAQHDFGYAAHAYSADADEVNGADVEGRGAKSGWHVRLFARSRGREQGV